MSTAQPTPAVPADFVEYLARGALLTRDEQPATPVPPEQCDGCGRSDQRCWRTSPDHVHCEMCLRRYHADDIAEQRTLQAVLGGAVKAALDLEISASQIRATVERAIDENIEASVAALRHSLISASAPPHEVDAVLREAEESWRR